MKIPCWNLLVCTIYANVFNIIFEGNKNKKNDTFLNFCVKWINKINAQVIYEWKNYKYALFSSRK